MPCYWACVHCECIMWAGWVCGAAWWCRSEALPALGPTSHQCRTAGCPATQTTPPADHEHPKHVAMTPPTYHRYTSLSPTQGQLGGYLSEFPLFFTNVLQWVGKGGFGSEASGWGLARGGRGWWCRTTGTFLCWHCLCLPHPAVHGSACALEQFITCPHRTATTNCYYVLPTGPLSARWWCRGSM